MTEREHVRMKVVVTRGPERDVADWVVDDGPPDDALAATSPGRSSSPVVFAVLASALVVAATVVLMRGWQPDLKHPLVPTVADLSALHAGVRVGDTDVRRLVRLAVGSAVETDGEGRARARLDDGTTLVLDRSTRVVVTDKGALLSHGRVFVQAAPGARTEIALGDATAILSGANAGAERSKDEPSKAKVYAATAELTVRAGGAEQTVRAGESATTAGAKVVVAPERAFDDWTGGMAAPWGARGAPRRAVGELWGRPVSAQAGEPGSPLTIRSHDVRATITREVAETQVRTTYFNAGSEAVLGDFRIALPPGAIVSRFEVGEGDAMRTSRVALAARTGNGRSVGALEWAGEGWLRGSLPAIASGATITVVVGYVEWLPVTPKAGSTNWLVQYRYPMASDATPPLIGEFSARVDASPSSAVAMASGFGARVTGQTVEIRRPDFRPTADLVVDVEIDAAKAPVRAFVAPPSDDDDEAGATVVVRTEVPAATRDDGVTLALVIDTSGSIDPSLLDAERALVEAVVATLGSKDRVMVLAADQGVGPVGPKEIGPADAPRRKAIGDALAALSPGGASDLGRALEAGADALPADAPSGMVIYVGDGWPTVGDGTVAAIQARLARRPGGAPRLGAVAVGPMANRFALASLVRGSGPLLEIADTSDAARTAVELVAQALQPTVAGVELVFGPEVERVYPRATRAVVAGETVMAVGRLRGDAPKQVVLRWRDKSGVREEKRAVVVEPTVDYPDVERRWAAARVDEVILSGKGREAAADVALRAGLVTPWTGMVLGNNVYLPSPLASRVLDLAGGSDAAIAAWFATPRSMLGTLADVPRDTETSEEDDAKAYEAAVAAATERVIADAGAGVRACRDSRAALRPELTGTLDVALSLDGEGRATDVSVRGTTSSSDDDALDRCVAVVVQALVYPSSGLTTVIKIKTMIELPPSRATLRAGKCSATSTLPLPLRRGVWRERLDRSPAWTVYMEAKQSCELPTWADRRTLLELVLDTNEDGLWRVDVARSLDRAGQADAANLLRREAVRRARDSGELVRIRLALLGDEHYPLGTFKKQYKAAADDRGRLAVVRRFLGIAPHDARLRRRVLALLEALGDKQVLAEQIRRIREDPFADAGLLADAASTLRRIGDEAGARRTFGELTERAPGDPWARAFLGDRLRNEGWYEDASAAYAVLEDLLPDDPAAVLRLALAHAGARRLDLAQRMLGRIARTGGRAGDRQLGELARVAASVLVEQARGTAGLPPEDGERLLRVALEMPQPAGATAILLRAPAGSLPVVATLIRGPKEAREERAPDVAAEGIGLYALKLDATDKDATLRLSRREELPPAGPTKVRVDALVQQGPGKAPRLSTTEVDLPATGKRVDLHWDGAGWSPEK